VFGKRVLRGIFPHTRKKVTSIIIKEPHNLCSLSDISRLIKLMKWKGHVACMEAKRNAFLGFDGKARMKEPITKTYT
jgi:hypothetical protein